MLGVKDTNWAVTGEVVGVDGVTRRWVYLHLFKQGQPTLNWLHPSFTTHELVVGDLLKTISDLGAKIVRFDANSLLGTERIADDSIHAKSLFHPLSAVSTQLLAMTVRKLGGYSYEENSILTRTLYVFVCSALRVAPDPSPRLQDAHGTGDHVWTRPLIRLHDSWWVDIRVAHRRCAATKAADGADAHI